MYEQMEGQTDVKSELVIQIPTAHQPVRYFYTITNYCAVSLQAERALAWQGEIFCNCHQISNILFFAPRANKTIDSLQKGRESEVAQLQAMLKKTEMRVNTLERVVEQKAQENNELTSICDELISKVGK